MCIIFNDTFDNIISSYSNVTSKSKRIPYYIICKYICIYKKNQITHFLSIHTDFYLRKQSKGMISNIKDLDNVMT